MAVTRAAGHGREPVRKCPATLGGPDKEPRQTAPPRPRGLRLAGGELRRHQLRRVSDCPGDAESAVDACHCLGPGAYRASRRTRRPGSPSPGARSHERCVMSDASCSSAHLDTQTAGSPGAEVSRRRRASNRPGERARRRDGGALSSSGETPTTARSPAPARHRPLRRRSPARKRWGGSGGGRAVSPTLLTPPTTTEQTATRQDPKCWKHFWHDQTRPEVLEANSD